MLCIVRHWLRLRTNPRSTSIVTMGSYVTYIGHRLGTQFSGDDIYKIPPIMDDKALRASHFIRISRRLTGRGVRNNWTFADMSEHELLIHSSISFGDDQTRRLEYIMGAPANTRLLDPLHH
jgi:hypothetical protein